MIAMGHNLAMEIVAEESNALINCTCCEAWCSAAQGHYLATCSVGRISAVELR